MVLVFPGFSRSPSHLQLFTAELQGSGYDAVAVKLAPRWLPFMYMNRRRLARIAKALIQKYSHREFVIIGHSAGAAAASFIAIQFLSRGANVKGLIFADGVDSPNRLIAESMRSLGQLPVTAVIATPSPCNRDGLLARDLAHYPNVRMVMIPDAGHGDIEGAGIFIYRKICKDTSTAGVASTFRKALLQALDEILN